MTKAKILKEAAAMMGPKSWSKTKKRQMRVETMWKTRRLMESFPNQTSGQGSLTIKSTIEIYVRMEDEMYQSGNLNTPNSK